MAQTIQLEQQITFKRYLLLVVPLTLSTITVPLLGAVDTALVGHLPNPSFIAGVTISTVIFNTLYWLFGFLRVSTTSFTAQALECQTQIKSAFIRPLFIALVLGLLFIVCQNLIFDTFIKLSKPSDDVYIYAKEYFYILIYGAPFTLINYVLIGFLMGRAHVKSVLYLQVLINSLNIVLSVLFVWYFNWNVKGVALSTLISQIITTSVGMLLVVRLGIFNLTLDELKEALSPKALKAIILINSDLMIRTVCLLTVTNLFISNSSELGTEILAANSILFQVQYLMAYIYDGFANAASILSGKSKGLKDLKSYQKTVKYAVSSGFGVAIILTMIWLGFDQYILRLFTNQADILNLALDYSVWMALFPISAAMGLMIYGLFCGINYTSSIRNSMLIAVAVWFISSFIFIPIWGNNGIWLSFILFCAARSLLVFWIKPSNAWLIRH